MAIPSKKSAEMEQFLEARFGRTTAILNNNCALCGGPAVDFKNQLSQKEYTISGLCQKCQNETFGE